jgi:hypothetical protein
LVVVQVVELVMLVLTQEELTEVLVEEQVVGFK